MLGRGDATASGPGLAMQDVLVSEHDLDSLTDFVQGVELTIVMPCLNEAETIVRCIRKAQTFIERSGIEAEIIVADNGSTDGSRELARAQGVRVVPAPLKGYGAALFAGLSAALGRYCILADCDDSYDFSRLDPFLERLRQGFDMVIGDRFAGGIASGAMPWKNRMIGNPVLSGIGRLFFVSTIRDFHCGLRGVSKEAFHRLDLRTTGMEFASEMIIKATLLNMRVAEVPTTLSVDGRSRRPHLRPYRDGWRHLRFMLLFSPNWLFFYPGLTLITVGLVLGMLLLNGPLTIGPVRLSLDTLIYCGTSIGVGVQAVLFAILSRTYAVSERLVPRLPGWSFVLDAITLERGLLLGGGIFAAGLATAVHGLSLWHSARFGALDIETISRVTIGSSLGLSIGSEIVFSSFLLSTLKLGTRSYPAASRAP